MQITEARCLGKAEAEFEGLGGETERLICGRELLRHNSAARCPAATLHPRSEELISRRRWGRSLIPGRRLLVTASFGRS